MLVELAFMIASVDGPKDVTYVKPPAPVVATDTVEVATHTVEVTSGTVEVTSVEPITVTAHLDSPEPVEEPSVAVTLDTGDGEVTTGPAEAEKAVEPISDEAAYHYRLCTQVQEVKYWSDWGCVDPAR